MEILEYANKGGSIVYILCVLSILGFTIMIFKFFTIMSIRSKSDILVEMMLKKIPQNEYFIESAKAVVSSYVNSLESGLNSVKIIANISPLLGLLGTVIGVFEAFEAISMQGLGDPNVFASGISLALITTVAGLIVAIPHYIGYNYLISMLDTLEINLQKDILTKAN